MQQIAGQNADLSAALQAQSAALRLRNERFAGAIESLSHGLCIYDGEHRLVFPKPTIASEAISFAHACEDAQGADTDSLVAQLRHTLARAS